MLRISMKDDTPVVTLKVEGRLVGPLAMELEKTWQDLWASAKQKSLRLDLRGVSFVDSDGARILREIVRATDAEVCVDSPLTQYYVNQAKDTIALEPTVENSHAEPKPAHSRFTVQKLQTEAKRIPLPSHACDSKGV